MTIIERHKIILDLLKSNDSVSVANLAASLNVSLVTIRKDLSQLEKQKLLYRSHGSAILINPYISDRHIHDKEKLAIKEKEEIGKKAAEQIGLRDSVIIASGTTMSALAKVISSKEHLTVITSSLSVTSILSNENNIEVIQLGGCVRSSSISVVGNYAEEMLNDFSCSKLYLGVDGVDLEYGITTTNTMEAALNRKMISASQKTIVLCDSSKFGKRGFGRICGLESIDQIITDDKISDLTLDTLKDLGIEVTVVSIK